MSCLVPTSTPRVMSKRSSTSGSVSSQRPISTFCWLPPESVPTCCVPASRSLDPQALDRTPRRSPARAGGRISRRARPARARRGQVVADGHGQHQPSVLRSSGTNAMARPCRIASRRAAEARGPAADGERPRVARRAPKSDRNSSGWPCPARPPTPRISPRRRSKEMPCQDVGPEVAAPAARRRAPATARLVRVHAVERPPGHERDRLGLVEPATGGDVGAVAENRDPVGEARTSLQRCEVKRTQRPSSRRRRMSPESQSTSCLGSAEVGSSRNSMSRLA